jgi:hypothetical protein
MKGFSPHFQLFFSLMRCMNMPDQLHVGSIVHHLNVLPPDDEHPDEFPLCEAALVTQIYHRETGLAGLRIFPEGCEVKEKVAAHGTTDGSWHFLCECPTGS